MVSHTSIKAVLGEVWVEIDFDGTMKPVEIGGGLHGYRRFFCQKIELGGGLFFLVKYVGQRNHPSTLRILHKIEICNEVRIDTDIVEEESRSSKRIARTGRQ